MRPSTGLIFFVKGLEFSKIETRKISDSKLKINVVPGKETIPLRYQNLEPGPKY